MRVCPYACVSVFFLMRIFFYFLCRVSNLRSPCRGTQRCEHVDLFLFLDSLNPRVGFLPLAEVIKLCFFYCMPHVLSRFCSVAYDTDKFFGSEGNFFLSEFQEVKRLRWAGCGIQYDMGRVRRRFIRCTCVRDLRATMF